MKHVDKVNFIGNNVNTSELAKEFDSIAGKSTCLFPISNISKRTFQKQFTGKAIDLIVYATKEKEIEKFENDFSVLIFTSPSNVRAYLKKNAFTSKQQIIVMGPSTGKELESNGIKHYLTPTLTSEVGLLDCLNLLD